LAISSFKNGQILKNEKGQIFLKKNVEITRFKDIILYNITSFAQISRRAFKIYYFLQHSKKAKNGQMVKSFSISKQDKFG